MLDKLIQLDREVFVTINSQWHNGLFDALLQFARNPYTWAPLYFFLLVFMWYNFRWKGAIWVLFFIATFGITDSISGQILKGMFERYRPCNDPFFSQFVRSLVPCAGRHSFPSNHAANHFALAMFMFLTLKRPFGKWMWVTFLWALLVSYAQIYTGQHYPSDIVYGTLAGLIFGTLTATIYNTKFKRFGL